LQSKNVTLAIKRDGGLGGVRVIGYAAQRIRQEQVNYRFLSTTSKARYHSFQRREAVRRKTRGRFGRRCGSHKA
jgi:hypothetical protein